MRLRDGQSRSQVDAVHSRQISCAELDEINGVKVDLIFLSVYNDCYTMQGFIAVNPFFIRLPNTIVIRSSYYQSIFLPRRSGLARAPDTRVRHNHAR